MTYLKKQEAIKAVEEGRVINVPKGDVKTIADLKRKDGDPNAVRVERIKSRKQPDGALQVVAPWLLSDIFQG